MCYFFWSSTELKENKVSAIYCQIDTAPLLTFNFLCGHVDAGLLLLFSLEVIWFLDICLNLYLFRSYLRLTPSTKPETGN